jgi:hypothetical protein
MPAGSPAFQHHRVALIGHCPCEVLVALSGSQSAAAVRGTLSSVLHLITRAISCLCRTCCWLRSCAENIALLFVPGCVAAARVGLVGVINTRWPVGAGRLLLPGYARESRGVVSALVRGFGVGACCGRARVLTCCALQKCSCTAAYAPIKHHYTYPGG